MISNEQKQIERRQRRRRERKFRLQLTTLSWTMPVIAFGSFFSIWHNISSAVKSPLKSKSSVSVVTNHPISTGTPINTAKSVTPSVLFKIGSRGPQVSAIQEQLSELGYFTHVITGYYGSATAQAVESFQLAQHLNASGEIDRATLTALKQAVKHHHTFSLVSSSTPTSPVTSNPKPSVSQSSSPSGNEVASQRTSRVEQSRQSAPQTTSPSTSSVAQSQQSTPQTTSPSTSSAEISQQSIPQTSSSAS